jgi:multimeric flavodoxin WrbA
MVLIVGIVGSPRVGGNTETLVAESLKAAREEGAQTELLRLAGKLISPCDGCLSCERTGECRTEDDFKPVFDKMAQADGLILATPVYFGSATPQLKALIDRAGMLSEAKGRLFENKIGSAMVVARRAGQNFTLAQILFFLLQQGMIIQGSSYWNMAFGEKQGDILKDEEGLTTARNTGKRMVWLIRKTTQRSA